VCRNHPRPSLDASVGEQSAPAGPLRLAVLERFLQQVAFWREGLKMVLTRANNDPAFGYYRKDPNADIYRASGAFVLTISEDQISSMTRFGDKGPFASFGLPRTVR
jgi:hypothetical protein